MIYFLFGNPGTGKTTLAKKVSSLMGIYFYDADDDIDEDIKAALHQGKMISQERRDRYFGKIFGKINYLHGKYKNIIVSQALIKEKNRKELQELFGKEIKFILVSSDVKIIRERIKQRDNNHHPLPPAMAEAAIKEFEDPLVEHQIVENNGDIRAAVKKLQSLIILNYEMKF